MMNEVIEEVEGINKASTIEQEDRTIHMDQLETNGEEVGLIINMDIEEIDRKY